MISGTDPDAGVTAAVQRFVHHGPSPHEQQLHG